MKRKMANLPDSLHQHLNVYALAAGAAGVSLAALAQPVEAKIVYTKAHVRIRNGTFNFDLNHDGTTDLALRQHSMAPPFGVCALKADPAQGNGIEEGTEGYGWAAALKAGADIGHAEQFIETSSVVMAKVALEGYGYWSYAQPRYLGVKFKIKGKIHYGWMRLKNSSCKGATLTGYAYETIPGKSIKAGATGENDDFINDPDYANPDDPGNGALLTCPIPQTPQPASLGMLALGAQGVPLWRRKQEMETVK